MLKTMQDYTDWRKPVLSRVDLLEIIEAVIIAPFPNEQSSHEIVRRG